jgi:hypothetical protein
LDLRESLLFEILVDFTILMIKLPKNFCMVGLFADQAKIWLLEKYVLRDINFYEKSCVILLKFRYFPIFNILKIQLICVSPAQTLTNVIS